MEIGLYEFIFMRSKVSDALDDVLDDRASYDGNLQAVYVVDEDRWWLVNGYDVAVKGILNGEEYFDVVQVGEINEGGDEDSEVEQAYYEDEEYDYKGWKQKRDTFEGSEVPPESERWVPDSTREYKGLEDFGEIDWTRP